MLTLGSQALHETKYRPIPTRLGIRLKPKHPPEPAHDVRVNENCAAVTMQREKRASRVRPHAGQRQESCLILRRGTDACHMFGHPDQQWRAPMESESADCAEQSPWRLAGEKFWLRIALQELRIDRSHLFSTSALKEYFRRQRYPGGLSSPAPRILGEIFPPPDEQRPPNRAESSLRKG